MTKIEIVGCVITFALAVIGLLLSSQWLVLASLAVIIALLITITTNLIWTPKPFRALKKKINKASKQSEAHPILKQFYENSINEIGLDLDQIIEGKFKFQITEVPDISIHAMKLVNKKCVLMFPIDNSEKLLTSEYGSANKYYLEMKNASKKMKENNLTGVIRVFILNEFNDISLNLLKFIQRNINDKINVKVILETELPISNANIESLDFGYYEVQDGHKWVMILKASGSLTDYIVETDEQIVSNYNEYSEAIVKKSHTYEAFMQIIMNPINGKLWPTYFAERGFEMNPPHGLSDEDADYIVDTIFNSMEPDYKPAVLVLGFTPKILKRLVKKSTKRIVSVDQYTTKPSAFKSDVNYITANWLAMSLLDMPLNERFDAILFDESINNLTKIQLNIFFPAIRNLLKPGGHLIGRVMGRFDDEITRKYENIMPWEAVNMLRKINGSNHDDVSPLIICLIHSKKIAFSSNNSLIDCSNWNNVLADLHEQDQITKTEYEQWKLQFNFKLLSPNLDLLLEITRELELNPFEIKQIRGLYVGKYDDIRSFYRLINFEFVGTHIDNYAPRK